MSNYRPQLDNTIPLKYFKPTYTTVSGVRKKTYDGGTLFYGSFKSYGGTERDVNGVYSIEDTARVECWYDPNITSECQIAIASSDTKRYEILGEPENVNMRNQFLKFKVRRIKGGV